MKVEQAACTLCKQHTETEVHDLDGITVTICDSCSSPYELTFKPRRDRDDR